MKAIRSSGYPESTLLQRGAILLYVHYLVKFLVTPVKALTKKFVACDCSPEVDKHLRSNYTINGYADNYIIQFTCSLGFEAQSPSLKLPSGWFRKVLSLFSSHLIKPNFNANIRIFKKKSILD